MPKHTSCHQWIFIVQLGGVQDHFPQNVQKFGFGDWKNVYEKRRPNPIFPQDTPKFGFGDGQKWGKKYMKREGSKLSIFKIEKIPIFSHDAPKFGFGDGKNVKKWGKKYMEREGKSIRFNKLVYIIIIVLCILNKIFRVP